MQFQCDSGQYTCLNLVHLIEISLRELQKIWKSALYINQKLWKAMKAIQYSGYITTQLLAAVTVRCVFDDLVHIAAHNGRRQKSREMARYARGAKMHFIEKALAENERLEYAALKAPNFVHFVSLQVRSFLYYLKDIFLIA